MIRSAAAMLAVVLLAGCAPGADAVGAIEIQARRSAFEPSTLTVPAGSEIAFTIRNLDPIAHEFIVGTPREQLRHEHGTDTDHDGAPGAASLDPGEETIVRYTFERPGRYEFACHLPGHYAYGMVGEITVT